METFVDRRIRHALEHAFLNNLKVSNSTPLDRIARLIRSLQPVSVPGGLRRIGPAGDGGYLLPDDFAGVGACISPGESCECGFDLEMAEMGMDVIMADASVSGPPMRHPRFQFQGKFLDVRSSEHTTTIDDLCKDTESDLVLQMDIEGAEHAVILTMSDSLLKRFRIAVIEFHEPRCSQGSAFVPLQPYSRN
jgi:methyltransferase FkbM-like protein